ncbi:hypothetical protein AB4043_02560, partial [Terriglobus sp. YAF25]
MSRQITPATSLDNLRREAKRWLAALRAQDSAALERFTHAHPKQTGTIVLRDVQHALAREFDFAGWSELKLAIQETAKSRTLSMHQQAAVDFVAAYKGDAEALERLNRYYHREFTLADLKAEIWRRDYAFRQRAWKRADGKEGDNEFPIEEAQLLLAQDAGFGSWEKLIGAVNTGQSPQGAPYAIDTKDNRIG